MTKNKPTNEDNSDITRVKSVDVGSQFTTPLASIPILTSTSTFSNSSYSYDPASSDNISLELGSIIKNTYELIEVLGEGGMGTVFKALNKIWEEVEARDPYVAIKILKPELSANKQLVRSLYSDYDRTKMLANCPNIIKVHGFDRDGPHVYMTMEYLKGKTLGEYLNRVPLNLTQGWPIIEGIGAALSYAHQHNIVHRDIKPGNVMITDDGSVKVLDFGIASKINESEGDETKFGGHELGALTVAYASPEMQKDYPPDARDDIYAFACVVYEILTGKQFYKQKTQKAESIRGLNKRQMEILNKSLAFERDQRTTTVNELLNKLRPVKTPWLKYGGIGGSLVFISGLVLWRALVTSPEIQKPQVEAHTEQPAVATVSTSTPIPVTAPIQVPEPAAKSLETAATEIQPIASLPPVETELSNSSTSSDGVVHLQTSKAGYKNGESFQLSFTLTQPMYVRVIDRDTQGEITKLRPNPRQPDKLLPADKEQVFPPKGFNIPVKGLAGSNTVTIIASAHPFSESMELLNDNGHVSEQVRVGAYSWTQVHYALLQ